MAKLHELLAAEKAVASAHNLISAETLKTLGKPAHFTETTTNIGHFDESNSHLDTEETEAMVTTVDDRMKYSFGRAFVNHIDLIGQKDRTNQEARADIIVDGKVLISDVPATTLLSLETRLSEKRKELEAVPTLQPGVTWEREPETGLHKAVDQAPTFRTKKTVKPVILHAATEHHPAQIQAITEDVPVAEITKTVRSGMWTSKQKADALARIDALLVATKKALQRANRTDVKKVHYGEKIANFVLSGPEADKLSPIDSTDEIAAA